MIATTNKFISAIKQHKCAFLTFFLLTYILLSPIPRTGGIAEKCLQFIFYSVIMFAPYFISRNRHILIVTFAVGAIFFIPNIISITLTNSQTILLPDYFDKSISLVNTIIELMLTGCIFHYSLSAKNFNEPVFGCVLTYLLIGIVFGNIYYMITLYVPNAFSGPFGDVSPDGIQLWYFSFITLTTCGYGDIIPLHPLPRIIAGLETVCGVLYVALFIGRLINSNELNKKELPEELDIDEAKDVD